MTPADHGCINSLSQQRHGELLALHARQPLVFLWNLFSDLPWLRTYYKKVFY